MTDSGNKSQPTSETRFEGWIETVAAAWAHRLNNTLGLIRSLAMEAERNSQDNPRVVDLLRDIDRVASRQLDAATDVVALSRLSTGSEAGPVDVNSVISKVRDLYEDISEPQNKPKIRLSLSATLPNAKADEQSLIEVIRNLVDNAIQALKGHTRGRVGIKSRSIGGTVVVEVSDNGPGVPSSLRERIFREPIGAKSRDSGLGWGLLIARRLVESWNGTLTLAKSNSFGTTFQVSLPKWQASHDMSVARRALVVDDDVDWLNSVSNLLHERGLIVDSASSVSQAAHLLANRQYDLALLDVRLADSLDKMDASGLLLASKVREQNPEALIILLTGYAAVDMVRDAFRSGVDDLMDKGSFSGKDLNKVLERIAVRRETRRESLRQSQVNKLMYESLSMVSHELRSPLLVIQRNVEALALGALGELTREQKDAVESIQSSVKREFVLLNAHLDLNRIERGAERLHYQEYDFVELVREEMAAHKAEADRKGIGIRSQLPRRKATVKIDVNRFRVALNPLMDNAIKFSNEGGEVSIKVRLKPAYVEVQISDQGPGIKPDELDRLMNLQSVESTSFSQRIRNSGLGLSMSKRMIELHEGRFWIESDGKTGTTVSFRLPIKKMR